MAVLPANLLISDPASEWLKLGVPIVMQHDLMTARTLIPGFANTEGEAIEGGATRLLRTSLENRQGELHIEATMVDASSHKVVRVETADATSASVLLPALNALAKKIDSNAIEFSTRSQQAWQTFATAEGSSNPQQRFQFLTQAFGQDQTFGADAVALITMIAPNRENDYKSIVDQVKAHRTSFAPYDRAKFDLALNRLANAGPADQIKAAQQALALAPNDLEVLTTLGQYQILAGDAGGGEKSLRRAASLNPTNAGLRFALARGLMEVKKFKEADTILSAINNTPQVYPELATCVLLEGDKARASTIAEKFINSVRVDEVKPLLRAAWDVMSGDGQKGVEIALNAKYTRPQMRAMALSEATVWQLLGQDFAGAQKTLALLNRGGGPADLSTVIGVLADKSTPAAEWQRKVQSLTVPDGIKTPVLAYGFFLRGNYDDAAKAWQKVSDESHGMDLHARAMLASSLEHLGKKADAGRIDVIPFSPEFTDLYSAISFTEMRRMLGK